MTPSLEGARVLVTRSRTQASRLSALLEERGAIALEAPTIEVHFASPTDGLLREAAERVSAYDGVIFTSPNGVRGFAAALDACGVRPASVPSIATVGPATARVATRHGLPVTVVPEARYVAEGLLESLVARGVTGQRFLLPRAAQARDILIEGLRQAGAQVDVVTAYETRPAVVGPGRVAAALDEGLDIVTVASSKTARFLCEMLDDALLARVKATPFAAIGPITAATCAELGLDVAVEADPHTLDGLVAGLERWWSARSGAGS